MKRQVQINPGLSSQLDEKRGSRHSSGEADWDAAKK
jgi:hypothetical protein